MGVKSCIDRGDWGQFADDQLLVCSVPLPPKCLSSMAVCNQTRHEAEDQPSVCIAFPGKCQPEACLPLPCQAVQPRVPAPWWAHAAAPRAVLTYRDWNATPSPTDQELTCTAQWIRNRIVKNLWLIMIASLEIVSLDSRAFTECLFMVKSCLGNCMFLPWLYN